MVKKDRQQVTIMILALLAAFIMWVYITNSENPQKSKTIYNVQVNLINQDNIQQSGLALLPDQTFTVSIKIVGSASDVNSITASDFTVSADMNTELVSGENKIYVKLQQTPRNVKVDTDKEKLYVTVQLDALKEKQVPVSIDVKGTPESGYENAGSTVKPEKVLVSGPAKYVDSVISASGKVDITGASSDVTLSTAVKALDKDGKEVSNVTVNPQSVTATVSIKASKTVDVSIKIIGSSPDGITITSMTANPNTVTIIGDEKVLSKITRIETQAIDISKISQNQYVDAALNLPEGVKVVNNAAGIRVTFNVENIIEKTLTVNLTSSGGSDRFNYALSSNTVQVTIKGKKSIIEGMEASSLTAVVDVSNLAEGSHDVSVKATAPSGAELGKINPDKITVTVTTK
jgi:YbbR domain-containing protein